MKGDCEIRPITECLFPLLFNLGERLLCTTGDDCAQRSRVLRLIFSLDRFIAVRRYSCFANGYDRQEGFMASVSEPKQSQRQGLRKVFSAAFFFRPGTPGGVQAGGGVSSGGSREHCHDHHRGDPPGEFDFESTPDRKHPDHSHCRAVEFGAWNGRSTIFPRADILMPNAPRIWGAPRSSSV